MVRSNPRPAMATTTTDTPARTGGVTGWLDDRLGLHGFYQKYGRKAFPVHSTFFFGEMALFSFVILVLTGIYLGLIYIPSNAPVDYNGQTYPEAYASVLLIESIPVANLLRSTHHWAAHLMVASVILHMLRVFFSGAYRKPRELNWAIGVALLGLTLMAGFVGYALPYDSYAVTATGIGFSIARSIPWIGELASELFFGGAFPTLGSLSRLYTIHVFVVPALLTAVMAAHLLIIVKQKHTQPGYAKRIAEPGKVLGVPFWPYQALLAGQLLLIMFGALFLLSAIVSPHPLQAFGPPGPTTPEVKPDWYLMWIYGFLKIVPNEASITVLGGTIGPSFIGGLLFPGLLFGVMTFAPWLDRTNRQLVNSIEYIEPPRQSPVRLATGIATLAFIGTLFIAAFYDTYGLSLPAIWAIVIVTPLAAGVITWLFASRTAPSPRFDPEAEPDEPSLMSGVLSESTRNALLTARLAAAAGENGHGVWRADGSFEPLASPPLTPADRARDNLVIALQEQGELSRMIRDMKDGPALQELLDYVQNLNRTVAESNRVLQESAALEDGNPGATEGEINPVKTGEPSL